MQTGKVDCVWEKSFSTGLEMKLVPPYVAVWALSLDLAVISAAKVNRTSCNMKIRASINSRAVHFGSVFTREVALSS